MKLAREILAEAEDLTVDQRMDLANSWPILKPGGLVDGREVVNEDNIPNTSSIRASTSDPFVLQGLREVPMDAFSFSGTHYSVRGHNRIVQLAQAIEHSKQITPLIVCVDQEGPYILEGATRSEALFRLKAKSFPALVVVDME